MLTVSLRRLPHPLLNAHCIAMRRFSYYPLNVRCRTMRRFHHQPLLAHCVPMRRVPVGRLPMHLLNAGFIALSHFSILPYSSRKCYPSLSLEHFRRSQWSIPLTWRHWHSSRSDIRGFPGCILLGVAASRYSMLKCSWAHSVSCPFMYCSSASIGHANIMWYLVSTNCWHNLHFLCFCS
jgi:hypothetical protein